MVSGTTFFGGIHIFTVESTYLAKKGYGEISVHSPFKVAGIMWASLKIRVVILNLPLSVPFLFSGQCFINNLDIGNLNKLRERYALNVLPMI